MKVIRNINFSDTLRAIPIGEFVIIPGHEVKDPNYLRSLSVRLPGKYTVNKIDGGASYKVTRLA
jgi:hypothetical protein